MIGEVHKEIIVSATEPKAKNRRKVWLQKGKNLFDGLFVQGNINSSGNYSYNVTSIVSEKFIFVTPGKTYRFSNNENLGFTTKFNIIKIKNLYLLEALVIIRLFILSLLIYITLSYKYIKVEELHLRMLLMRN